MRAWNTESAQQECKQGYISIVSDERCLSGQRRSTGEQAVQRHQLKSLQKDITTLLETSLRHLLITPPFHLNPPKINGFVVSGPTTVNGT